MAEQRYFLNESDRQSLQGVIDSVTNKSGRRSIRSSEQRTLNEEYPAPEVYVAKTPVGGIPALVTSVYDQPGYAVCPIYRTVITSSGIHELHQISTDLTKRVYNITVDDIPGDTWVIVLRDKFGGWYASTGGGAINTRLVQLTAVCFYDGSDTRDVDGCPDGTGLMCVPENDCLYRFPLHSWRKVSDTGDPTLITYVDGVLAGSPQCLPVIHVQGIPLPTFPPPSPIGNFPNTAVDYSGAGQATWANASNATASDNVYATCALDIDQSSHYLKLTGFCFGLHANTTITDITCVVEAHTDAGNIVDVEVKLVVDGSITGTSRHTGTEVLPTTDADYSFSGTPSQWGVSTLTVLQINSPLFGVVIRYGNSLGDQRTIYVDSVELRISFSPTGKLNVPHSTVRVWKGAGDYWLTDTPVWRGLYRRTGFTTADGRECYYRYRDSNAQDWRDGELAYEILAQ